MHAIAKSRIDHAEISAHPHILGAKACGSEGVVVRTHLGKRHVAAGAEEDVVVVDARAVRAHLRVNMQVKCSAGQVCSANTMISMLSPIITNAGGQATLYSKKKKKKHTQIKCVAAPGEEASCPVQRQPQTVSTLP